MRNVRWLVLAAASVIMLGALPSASGAGAHASPPEATGQRPTDHHRDVPAFQDARNRQVKSFTVHYRRICPTCTDVYTPSDPDGSYVYHHAARGRIHYEVGTYKILDQNRRYDFYLVDATATWKRRRGDEDWGWLDTYVTSRGRTKVLSSSYTLGKSKPNTTTCKRYPIQLGVSFLAVEAGTTAAHVTLCNDGSKVSSTSVSRGREYHATGVSGFKMLQMQRYVRVPQGKHPLFRIATDFNAEYVSCFSGADGYHCYVIRQMGGAGTSIGTKRQS